VVTENLKDGPPEDDRGRRIFDGVLWCHPDLFLSMVSLWSDFVATGSQDLPPSAGQGHTWSGPAAGARGVEIPVAFLELLDGLAVRSSPNPTRLRTLELE
jgi:hypothetical protein